MWAKAAAPSSPAGLEAVLTAPHRAYMQHRLLQDLGDLDMVWMAPELRSGLLELPLPAVQLLLSNDSLQVRTHQLHVSCFCRSSAGQVGGGADHGGRLACILQELQPYEWTMCNVPALLQL